jgi:DNA-binding GntR family transcriptional regulator
VRRAYPPSATEHERTLDVHRRQLAAMRARDLAAVRVVLDEHFRILEETVAARRGNTWDELFAPATTAGRAAPPRPSGR